MGTLGFGGLGQGGLVQNSPDSHCRYPHTAPVESQTPDPSRAGVLSSFTRTPSLVSDNGGSDWTSVCVRKKISGKDGPCQGRSQEATGSRTRVFSRVSPLTGSGVVPESVYPVRTLYTQLTLFPFSLSLSSQRITNEVSGSGSHSSTSLGP